MYRVSRAVDCELTTLDLMLISKQGLLIMKEVAGRPQDIADIDALRRMDNP